MITKKIATSLHYGQILHHMGLLNSDGTPVRCRVSGACKTWKTRPDDFRLPVKHGLYDSFYITPRNANEWCSEMEVWDDEGEAPDPDKLKEHFDSAQKAIDKAKNE